MYRLLIVDEDARSSRELLHMLDWRKYGFTSLMTACTYPEAVSKALDLIPHVALISVKLGEHRGWELAAQLRKQGVRAVCAMTADSCEPDIVRASMRAGARDFLMRPVDPEQLKTFVEWSIVNELGGSLPQQEGGSEKVDPVLRVEYQSLSKITNKILLYTQNNFRAPLSLIGIAEEFKMSSKYIGRVFLGDTGMKYSEYLMAYRMLEARKLIISTRNKISVIANMVGYPQLNNFYIHFKRYFGMSPGDLRNPVINEKET